MTEKKARKAGELSENPVRLAQVDVGSGERMWRRNSYHNHWDLRIFNKVRKITKQFWKLKCTYEFFFSSHKYWIAVTWINRALYMRINMETRNYIHCVVVYFAKKQWTAIVYIFLISLYINKWNSLTRRSRLVLYELLTGHETTFYCTKVLRLWDEMFALYTKSTLISIIFC